MLTLKYPLPDFQRLLLSLAENRGRVADLSVGINQTKTDREWLARGFVLSSPDGAVLTGQPVFRVSLVSQPPSIKTARELFGRWPVNVIGQLYLGEGGGRGQAWGFMRHPPGAEPLDYLKLPGSGLHAVRLRDDAADDERGVTRSWRDHFIRSRWSRTIGALGGAPVWRRLTSLRVTVVGCGRTGSIVAAMLARMGLRHLTLIDGDLIETHNLGEMDVVTDADLGRHKAEAIAGTLNAEMMRAGVKVTAIAGQVTHPHARAAITGSDVVFCCVDNDAARLATALLATLYHVVLIDTGTGIFFEADSRRAGADVRLVLPGDGCLLCRGNLSNYNQAIEDLCNHRPLRAVGGWRSQRAGSLRTVNQLAAAVSVQMLQDLTAERIRASTWAQPEFDDQGKLSVGYPLLSASAPASACALCAKAGLGNNGIR